MKIRNLLLGMAAMFVLSGCFKDEGDYTYLPDSAPVFDYPVNNQIYCYEGDTTFFEGKYHFTTADSLERMGNVSYAWEVNGVVLSREKDFNVPTDEAMKMLGLTEFPSSFLSGTYGVIDRQTGMKYLTSLVYNFVPAFGLGNWMILSKNGSNARLSYQRLVKKTNGPRIDSIYYNYAGIYKERNGEEIAGTPRMLLDHYAPHISSYAGATLVVTDREAYEVSNEKLEKAKDLKNEFLSGAPGEFVVKDAHYFKQYTLLALENGNLYRRAMSENYLGGKFISEPYTVDHKGCEIDFFGNGQGNSFGFIRMCYDRKNHRILMINQQSTPIFAVMPLEQAGTGHVVTPWDLGEGAEVLAISEIGSENWDYGYDGACYCMIYNQAGKTYIAHFYVENRPPSFYAHVLNNAYMKVTESPVQLSKDNIIRMTSSSTSHNDFYDCILYSRGNEIRYIDRTRYQDHLLVPFDSKVTAFRFAIANNSHKELGVGLTNGDFVRVNVRNIASPQIVEKSRFNVGGEVADVSHTGGKMYSEE